MIRREISMLTYQGKPVRELFDVAGDEVYLHSANICPCTALTPGPAMDTNR